jgi:hypothetical protein
VQWVRDHYCAKAVETDAQARWVERFVDAEVVPKYADNEDGLE